MKLLSTLLFSSLCFTGTLFAEEINLAGEWSVNLLQNVENTQKPTRGEGPTGNRTYHLTLLSDTAKQKGKITLPGSLDEGGYGEPVLEPDIGCLSRKVRFIGKAVYTKDFIVDTPIKNAQIYLERVMWGSTLKLDGKPIGSRHSLATPHIYNVGDISKGKHILELIIDNSMLKRVGEKGHAYGEHMQTIWNGVIGKMSLRSAPTLENVAVHAPGTCDVLDITFNTLTPREKYTIALYNVENKNEVFSQTTHAQKLSDSKYKISLPVKNVKPWNEFDPQLYALVIKEKQKELFNETIGFRSLNRVGNKMYLNDQPLFLRGNLDNCHFPLTGYPSAKVIDWEHIFKISKQNGINQIRFHSYCPPKAAFEAADKIGIYLAPESNMWIDGWMPRDMQGKPYIGMGQGDDALDQFVRSELEAMIKTFGNHASFCMIGIGNECGNSNFDKLNEWMTQIKQNDHADIQAKDQKRLYSLSTARQIKSVDDFTATHNYPGVGGTRQWMNSHTDWDYEGQYGRTQIPCIAHEIGQWPIYPDFEEIKKYTGVLRPWNLEVIQSDADTKGVLRFNKAFNNASGHLNRLMYKDEIESFMRTPSCRGIHLLGMQDYSGQGEALIGWLNSFYENKGYWDPISVKGCFSEVVTLARFPKYTWRNNELFKSTLQARNMTYSPLKNVAIKWEIFNSEDRIISEGKTPFGTINIDEVKTLGDAKVELNSFPTNEKYTLKTYLVDDKNHAKSEVNQWDFWIYDQTITHDIATEYVDSVLITESLDEAIKALKSSKSVLLFASELGSKGNQFNAPWGAVYWSTTWFPGQPTQTLGLTIEKNHPVFNLFKTDDYGNWQWRDICNGAHAFDLKELNITQKPIIMPVPDFHNNNKLGSLFELKIDSGKLLVCGYNLDKNQPQHQQLKKSLYAYIGSNAFNPVDTANLAWVEKVFNPVSNAKWNKPKDFEDALYYIECGKFLDRVNQDVKHNERFDYKDLGLNKPYEVKNISLWNDGKKTYWVAQKDAEIIINLATVNPGKIIIDFADPNHNNRTGEGSFEGRPFKIKPHGGKVERFETNIDREDCIDKKLVIKVSPTSGPNLMVERIIYMPQKTDGENK